jgi:hypothetical protein
VYVNGVWVNESGKDTEEKREHDGFDDLGFAIIRQAVDDYKKAIRTRDYFKITSLEKFFLSDWGQTLSDFRGEYIIDQVRKWVKPKPETGGNEE